MLSRFPLDNPSMPSELGAECCGAREPNELSYERVNWSVEELKEIVERCTPVLSDSDVWDKMRKLIPVAARRVAMVLMRMAGHSYPAIGAALGFDHTTVVHHVSLTRRLKRTSRMPMAWFFWSIFDRVWAEWRRA